MFKSKQKAVEKKRHEGQLTNHLLHLWKQRAVEKKRHEEWIPHDVYREVEQEINRIQEECVTLQEKKKGVGKKRVYYVDCFCCLQLLLMQEWVYIS